MAAKGEVKTASSAKSPRTASRSRWFHDSSQCLVKACAWAVSMTATYPNHDTGTSGAAVDPPRFRPGQAPLPTGGR